ncbi:MAG: MarR family transcriptional regulator [Betaproteobacteria bacterium]|jgi:DNA-binding MarR family transcriptional regulator|nr:MarR family transcriptional regulator [Betaproteobacteria bacterium]NBP35860.1 MarR family transcriptional regulator [Betaproteobacteria bacterium]NBP39193.1 MarR family transcriptional regulator [Betaproteobacteria bacterium]NBQ78448.1 MarR family transcriptional regulator [Betaproteobacteria bacterium]NBQ95078.1 MarR family transcriptional regulator [Betaproteobacteria bacterium]
MRKTSSAYLKKQDLASIGERCTCLALRSAARTVARIYDEALRSVALNNGQFSILVAVSAMQPVSIQGLGERLGMDRTTVTAALKPLQRRALIVIEIAEDDLRGRCVSLTPVGRKLLKRAVPLWEKAQESIALLVGGEASAFDIRNKLAAIH